MGQPSWTAIVTQDKYVTSNYDLSDIILANLPSTVLQNFQDIAVIGMSLNYPSYQNGTVTVSFLNYSTGLNIPAFGFILNYSNYYYKDNNI